MSVACGLDLLFAAAATTSGVVDDARESVQIQKMRRARGASEKPLVRDATRERTGGFRRFKYGKGGAGLVDVTNGRVRSPKTPGVGSASAKRGRNARRAPESESEDDDARVRVDEECVRVMEILANEHADVVIERVREGLDLLAGDARARLGALRKSAKRTRAAVENFEREGVTEGVGMSYLREFERMLEIERELLEKTLRRVSDMRTKAEYEAAKLALGWLDRSNRKSEDDSGASDEENSAWAHKRLHSSSAHAFLRTALAAYVQDTAPEKSLRLNAGSKPSEIVTAATLHPQVDLEVAPEKA